MKPEDINGIGKTEMSGSLSRGLLVSRYICVPQLYGNTHGTTQIINHPICDRTTVISNIIQRELISVYVIVSTSPVGAEKKETTGKILVWV